MSLLQIFVLAVVQGITEFLPISSSGHLILVPALTDWPDQGLMMDIGVHLGTLGAVMLYFRQEMKRLTVSFFHLVTFKKDYIQEDLRLLLYIVLATIPVVVIGYIAKTLGWTEMWRTIEVIGYTSIIFGLLLYYFDMKMPEVKEVKNMTTRDVIIIGFAQVIALIPGTSRSGITMTAARALKMTRTDAARFSMIMSIPTILAASLLSLLDLMKEDHINIGADLLIGMGLSFVTAIIAITVLMNWLKKSTMTIFVIYRVLLGIGLLALVYI